MLGSPPNPFVAGVEAVLVAGAALALGYLCADLVARRSDLDSVARWGLALPGFVALVLVAMLLHIATGGAVLGNAWATRGLALAAAGALGVRRAIRRGERSPPAPRADRRAAAAAVALAVLVWGVPTFLMLPLDHTGDTNLHAGWASQLLNGEPVPSGPITGDIPNFYPWLFHAVAAFLARFTPGGRAYHVLGPLQLLLVAGAVLGLFALGRELTRRWTGGAAAAVLGGLAGGVGWVLLRGIDVVLEPRGDAGRAALRYGGDLLFRRSYNVAFHNLSPPFPRDLALALLIAFLLLLVAGVARRSLPLLAWGGAVLGLTGLAGGESFFVGGGVAVLTVLLVPGMSRLRAGAALLAPAAALYALWLVPLVWNYLRLGFVSITLVGPVDLPPWAILVSWGISTPLAVWGVLRSLPGARTDPGLRVLVALLVVSGGILLASVLIPQTLGQAFLSLGRRHRYWPLLHLGVALWAALGATRLLEAAARRRRGLAVALAAALLATALPSPLVASAALPRRLGAPPALQAALRGDPGSVFNLLSPAPGTRCTAAVPAGLSVHAWAYTGQRHVLYVWSREYKTNRARLRWRDIYAHIPGDDERIRANDILTTGSDPDTWREVADRFGVDVVVVPAKHAGATAFRSVQGQEATGGSPLVFRLGSCD